MKHQIETTTYMHLYYNNFRPYSHISSLNDSETEFMKNHIKRFIDSNIELWRCNIIVRENSLLIKDYQKDRILNLLSQKFHTERFY